MRLIAVYFMTPEPAPTVTVTETVVVTPPVPIVTVQMPPDTFDAARDIVLTGDFAGAIVGVAGAVAITYWLIRRERAARLDERRRDQVTRLATTLRSLCFATAEADRAVLRPVLQDIAQAASPLVVPTRDGRYEEFRNWLLDVLPKVHQDWFARLVATTDLPVHERLEKRHELAMEIVDLQANIERWGQEPSGWRPLTGTEDRSAEPTLDR